MRVFPAGFPHTDDVAGLHLERGNIDLLVVDENVAVIDQLSGLTAGSGKTSAIDSIVQPPLEQEQKVLTRNSLHASSAFEIVAKLPFQNEVNTFDLLLLAQLLAIANERFAAAHGVTVLSGRLRTAFLNRASGFVTTIALQKKLRAFATAKAAHCFSIPSQVNASSLIRRKSLQVVFMTNTDPSSFGLIHCRLSIADFRFTATRK